MGGLAASYSHDRGTVCVEGISNRRSNGRRSYQLVLRLKSGGKLSLPRPIGNRQTLTLCPPSGSDYPHSVQVIAYLRLWPLELRGREPVRERRIVCDCTRGSYRDSNLLRHAVEAKCR